MSTIDRLHDETDNSPEEESEVAPPGPARAAVVGIVTGLGSLSLPVVIALLAWLLDRRSTGSGMSVVGAGSALWLLGQGVTLTTATLTVSITSLLLLAGAVAAAWFGLREALRGVAADGPHWYGLVRIPIAASIGAWWAGYAAVVFLASALALAGPFGGVWWTVALPLIAVPLVTIAIVLARLVSDEPYAVGPRMELDWLPMGLRRAVGPAIRSTGVALAAGLVMVLVALALGIGEVSRVHAALGAGTFGAIAMSALQITAAPNFGLWALSFAAGPGFQIADGASTTWSGSRGALMPLIPVFAGLPQPGDFPRYAALAVLIPLAIGAYAGHRAVGSIARLSSVRSKVEVALVTALLTAAALALLDLIGGGALGRAKLGNLGAPTGWFFLALLAELALGAVVMALIDAWRLRR